MRDIDLTKKETNVLKEYHTELNNGCYDSIIKEYKDPATKYCFDILNEKILSCYSIKLQAFRHIQDLRRITEDDSFNYYYDLTVLTWVVSSHLIGTLTNDPRPWIDGLSFAVSLTGGIICFLRYRDQYFWWVFSSIFQMILWAVTFAQGGATIAMLVSSSVYFVNDIIAFTVSPWFNMGRRKMGLKEIQ